MVGLSRKYQLLLGFIFLLAFVSFTLNIKQLTLIPDESLRALVALEMHLTGDYITPKMGGEYYFKKPPVYNWIVAGYYQLTGDYSEMATRVPMLVSFLALSFLIFGFAKKYFDKKTAILAALVFAVSPRIISYETLFGLIDMTYSLVVFLTIVLTWQFAAKKKYVSLFLITYFLTALSFLMKGIPSIAYQGLTLLVVFLMNKEFQKLFSWQHLLGGLLFISLVSGYYFAYSIMNPGYVETGLRTIFMESAEKSGIAYSFTDVLRHSVSFVGEIFYNFLPASLFVVLLFNSKIRQFVVKQRFVLFLSLAFVANISIYLISPTTYMRYVIPHFALLSIAFAASYFHLKESENIKLIKSIDGFFLVVALLIWLGHWAYGFVPQLDMIEFRWIKLIVLSLLLGVPLLLLFKKRQFRIELLIISLLVFKLGFNWFIIPSRTHGFYLNDMREKALIAGERMQGKKVILYNEGLIQTTHFYLTAGKRELIPIGKDTTGIDFFIGYSHPLDLSKKQVVDSFRVEGTENLLKIYKFK
ncbi:MAG: glycosyltransferase family 39 protein [Bacteroidales bacterium]|nr:glycosyltransferase family 39 protein [Bacteroidales bacterium]